MHGIKKLLVVAVIVGSVSSCSWIKTVPNNPVVQGVIDCAQNEVAKVAQTLIGEVSTILATNASDWENQLLTIAKNSGTEALACAVEQVTQDFNNNVTAAPSARNANVGATNGNLFIKEQGYQFAAGQ